MIDIVTRLRAKASRLDENGVIGANSASADMKQAADEIETLRKIEKAARDVAETLNGGFIRCQTCGDQETTTDVDYARELYAALGIEPKL